MGPTNEADESTGGCLARQVAEATGCAGLSRLRRAFLAEDEGETWAVAMRERLRGKFIHALATCGQALEAQGHLDEAIQLYVRGIEADWSSRRSTMD